MSQSGGHAVVFETPGRVEAFVLQVQIPGVHANVRRDFVRLLKNRLPFPDRLAFVFRHEREQFMESPDAAERRRNRPLAPFLLEFLEAFRDGQFIPFVLDVQQSAAGRAGGQHFGNIVGFSAENAFLIRSHDLRQG